MSEPSPDAAPAILISSHEDIVECINSSPRSTSPVRHAATVPKKKRVRIKIKKRGSVRVRKSLLETEASQRELMAARMIQRKQKTFESAVMALLCIHHVLFCLGNYRRKRFTLAVEKMLLYNRRRRDILAEILATEKTYVTCLGQLKRDFVHPLSAVMSETEMQNVFPNVVDLWKLHEHVLSQLSTHLATPQPRFDSICQLFSDMATQAIPTYGGFLGEPLGNVKTLCVNKLISFF
jgi:hypothetical protein